LSQLLSDYWLHFATDVAILALAALGLYVCFIAGQFSLAHAALMGGGAYAAGAIATKTELPYTVGFGVAIVVGTLLSLAMGALLALRLREFYLAIGTLAFNLAVIVVINNNDSLGGPTGLLGISLETTANMALVAVALVVVAVHLVERTRLGRAMRAIHDDETMAAANGVRVWRVKLATFAISGAITGLAGGMHAHFLGLARPDHYGFAHSTELWVPVIVGGASLVIGPLIGAFVVGIVPEILNRQLDDVDPLIISGALLILAALFRPSGLVRRGDLRRLRERFASSPADAAEDGAQPADPERPPAPSGPMAVADPSADPIRASEGAR